MGRSSWRREYRVSSTFIIWLHFFDQLFQSVINPGASSLPYSPLVSSDGAITVTGKVITKVAVGTKQDVDIAVDAARKVRNGNVRLNGIHLLIIFHRLGIQNHLGIALSRNRGGKDVWKACYLVRRAFRRVCYAGGFKRWYVRLNFYFWNFYWFAIAF